VLRRLSAGYWGHGGRGLTFGERETAGSDEHLESLPDNGRLVDADDHGGDIRLKCNGAGRLALERLDKVEFVDFCKVGSVEQLGRSERLTETSG
jgi:YD repeat-containing protein